MANKFGDRQPIDSLSGVAPSRPGRFTPRPSARSPNPSVNRQTTPDSTSRHAPKLPAKPSPKTRSQSKKNEAKTVSFELALPRLKIPARLKARNIRKSPGLRAPRTLVAFVLLIAIVGGIVAGVQYFKKQPNTLGTTTEIKQTSPTFDTLAPADAGKKEQPVSYDGEKDVASFAHKIGDVDVTVSQQPLPDKFIANPAQELEALAKNFKANKVITAGDVKAYSGFSSVDGTQTVVFTKNSLLIFIRAEKALKDEPLAQYIISLK